MPYPQPLFHSTLYRVTHLRVDRVKEVFPHLGTEPPDQMLPDLRRSVMHKLLLLFDSPRRALWSYAIPGADWGTLLRHFALLNLV